MKKLLILLFSLFFLSSPSVFANKTFEWEDLIQVFYGDEFCYYAERIKPMTQYDLHEEWEDYYILKSNGSCDDFLKFNQSVHKVNPNKSHLPANGEIIYFNEYDLTINTSKMLDGKVISSEKSKNGVTISKTDSSGDITIKELYDSKGKISKKELSKPDNFEWEEHYYYDSRGKIILNYVRNKKNNTLVVNEINLPLNNLDYYAIKGTDDYIGFKFNEENTVVFSVNEYGDARYENFQNNKKNGLQFQIRLDTFEDYGYSYFDIDLFEDGKHLFNYSFMYNLAFESPMKNNLEDGIRLQFSGSVYDIYEQVCYIAGEKQEYISQCDLGYLSDIREKNRNALFNYDLSVTDSLQEFLLVTHEIVNAYFWSYHKSE